MLAHKSRTKRHRNTKIGRKVAYRTDNNTRSKIKVTRPTNASYPPKWKAYELQNGYTDGACAINCHGQLHCIKACEVGFLHASGGIP